MPTTTPIIEYGIPGSNRTTIWTGSLPSGTGKNNKLSFIINTGSDDSGWLEFHVNGVRQNFNSVSGSGTRTENMFTFTVLISTAAQNRGYSVRSNACSTEYSR
ncbi:hypothetical protein Q9L58_009764 [Maublancomyces gigas]|uniref:Uncharacterized protein n=1 Tax=Discina gigas TaxID=1032678 RepID=A0ABR3G6G2_9PEZI